ncbi:LAMI_0D08658g1_1 [Lachancea mirantina]|uniref:LAMI_0D08658g1_1 n=1 Tax=Lachancea mirantina TaxID=1230905 RepID=A0A1G4JDF1_9SACH|nr:LAMI_0D08658g1_1 [Lachancea mirantina]
MSISFEVKRVEVNGYPARILLQNENGPCALLAMCNVLLLSPQHKRQARDLIELVDRQDTVTLNELNTVLANIAVQNTQGEHSDVNHLLQLLPQLHTGLSIDPVFNGSFSDGEEMSLFRIFNVSIVHGWIADMHHDPDQYGHVAGYSYESAQKRLVEAYEIQHGQPGSASVTQNHAILEDANYIKAFLARSATQLTDYGLVHLKEVLLEKSYAILFRNDHFSTIIKSNGELFLLVTDQGFRSSPDIVWQSLKSVNGSQDTFYTGDFISASLQKAGTQTSYRTQGASQHGSNPFLDPQDTRSSPRGNEYMTDEELARQLQEQEDARVARSMQRGYTGRRGTADEAEPSNSKSKKKSRKTGRKRDKLKKSCTIM